MVRRGQVWTLLRGGSQYRVLVISNDEYNRFDELAIWALIVARDVPRPHQLAVRLGSDDPLPGAFVKIHAVLQVDDRGALRDNHGFVSHDTMNEVEYALRQFLELP
jgi:mRNA interferase MazF